VWRSTDYGVDWVDVMSSNSTIWSSGSGGIPYGFIGAISMDPLDHRHLIASSHGACNSPLTKGCYFESHDGATTWGAAVSFPFAWNEGSGVYIVSGSNWIFGTGCCGNQSYVTNNAGTTWSHSTTAGDGLTPSVGPGAPAADGAYYVGSLSGPMRSTDGFTWALPWSIRPQTPATVTSATTLFASGQQSYYSAPLAHLTPVTTLPTPSGVAPYGAAGFLAYDQARHILYSSTWATGAFRMQTP
jgi:hypothetical protein